MSAMNGALKWVTVCKIRYSSDIQSDPPLRELCGGVQQQAHMHSQHSSMNEEAGGQ